MHNLTHDEFNRKKIYQNLQHLPEPENYKSDIPWIIQCRIADTNGKQYTDVVGKLKLLPVYTFPVKQVSGDKLMLDIGQGGADGYSQELRKGIYLLELI